MSTHPHTRSRTRTRPQDGTGQSAPRPGPRAAKGPSFAALGIDNRIIRLLDRQGITTPRPIQADTVEAALDGRDVCGRAPTGSGKTLAFALPLASMTRGLGQPLALVLAPTRELALQIAEVLTPLASPNKLRVRTLIGGTKINKDISALDRGVDIVVGCPGRMVDLMNQGVLDLSQVSTAVLDEADRMADMGFMPDVTRLLDATGCTDGQLLLFSATLDETTDKLERRYQTDPVRVDVGTAPTAEGDVSHTWEVVPRQARKDRAISVLGDHDSAIVFTRTKRGADRLARQLSKAGHDAVPIHGDRSQSQRQKALARFTAGKARVLVATDIAARGIHVDDVDLVLHFDIPATAEDYTHRSGRTGRAGADGTAVALVCEDQTDEARDLLKGLSMTPAFVGDITAAPTDRPAPQPRGGGSPRGGGKPRNGGGSRSSRGSGGGRQGGQKNRGRRTASTSR